MSAPIVRYPLDTTGINPDNFVSGEVHHLVDRQKRAIATTYGPFFNDSVSIVEVNTNRILTHGVHYVFAELYQGATLKYGKSVSGVIIVIDSNVLPDVSISYQVLGGEYSYSTDALVNLLNAKIDDDPTISWYNIIGKPDLLPPSQHLHDVGDVFGFEYVVQALERIRNAILWSDVPTYDALVGLINNKLNETDSRFNTLLEQNLEAAIISLRTQFTKQSIGLGNIQNYLTGGFNDGQWAGNKDHSIDQITANKYIGLDALVGFREKLLDYMVLKENTGIGNTGPSVKPLTRATLASMVNGATVTVPSQTVAQQQTLDFEFLVYPPNTSENNSFTIVKLTNNPDNRGGLYLFVETNTAKMYIAKTNTIVDWPIWNEIILADNLTNIVRDITDLVAGHINNHVNPHNTTKAQLGLGLVENLAAVNQTDLDLRRNVRKYVTLADLNYYSQKWLITNTDTTIPPTPEAGTVFTATLKLKNRAGEVIGYMFAASDTRDPRANTVVKDATGSTIGYLYPNSNPDASVAFKNHGGSTIGYILANNTLTIAAADVAVTASAVIAADPTSIALGETSTITYTLSGLTPNSTYVLTYKVTSPTNVISNYSVNGNVITGVVTSNSTGDATSTLNFLSNGQAVGTWTFSALATRAGEVVTLNCTGGAVLLT